MLRVLKVNVKEFTFFMVVVAACSFAQKNVYLSPPGLLLAFGISFFSNEFSFLLYMAGLTGLFGIQMNGTDNLAEIAVIAQLIRMYLVRQSITVSSDRVIRKLWKYSICAILLLAINIFVAYWRWGQTISAGIVVNRRLIELLGIPLYCSMIQSGKLKMKDLLENLAHISFWFCLVLILQYLLMQRFHFLPVQYAGRGGNEYNRILIHNFAPLLCLLSGNQLYKLLKQWTGRGIVYFIVFTYTLMVVAKGRMMIIAMLVLYFFELLHFGKGINKGVKNILMVFIGGLILFIMGDQLVGYVQSDFFADIFERREDYIRMREIEAYFNTLKTAPLLGAGVYSSNFANPVMEGLIKDRLFVSDIGIFGDFYSYGIFIVIIVCSTLWKTIHIIRYLDNKEIQVFGKQLIMIVCVTMWTVPSFTFIAPLTVFLMCAVTQPQTVEKEVLNP